MKVFKGTSGISRWKKQEEQRRGSLKISGISFVGTALSGYVTLFVENAPVSCIRTLD